MSLVDDLKELGQTLYEQERELKRLRRERNALKAVLKPEIIEKFCSMEGFVRSDKSGNTMQFNLSPAEVEALVRAAEATREILARGGKG